MVSDITVECIDRGGLLDDRLKSLLSAHMNVEVGRRNQCFFVASHGHQVVGALLGLRRPTTTMLRLFKLWTSPVGDRTAISKAVYLALDKWSGPAGVDAWRLSSDRAEDDFPQEFVALLKVSPTNFCGGYLQHWRTEPLPSIGSPLYTQTTDFTCGAACLMMAFTTFDRSATLQRGLELQLWREATSIVSLDGPGGCDPYGVALAAAIRGFGVRVFMSTNDPVLIEAGDSDANRDIIGFVQAELRSRLAERSVQVEQKPFSIDELRSAIRRGGVAIVLVDQVETHAREVPHWILLHSAADTFFLANDPWFERADHEQPVDVIDLPIRDAVLDKMAWYGAPPYRAAVLIEPAA